MHTPAPQACLALVGTGSRHRVSQDRPARMRPREKPWSAQHGRQALQQQPPLTEPATPGASLRRALRSSTRSRLRIME